MLMTVMLIHTLHQGRVVHAFQPSLVLRRRDLHQRVGVSLKNDVSFSILLIVTPCGYKL